jgi:hypothetical protein
MNRFGGGCCSGDLLLQHWGEGVVEGESSGSLEYGGVGLRGRRKRGEERRGGMRDRRGSTGAPIRGGGGEKCSAMGG